MSCWKYEITICNGMGCKLCDVVRAGELSGDIEHVDLRDSRGSQWGDSNGWRSRFR